MREVRSEFIGTVYVGGCHTTTSSHENATGDMLYANDPRGKNPTYTNDSSLIKRSLFDRIYLANN